MHLAQLNISRMLAPSIDHPLMADFVAQLDTVNALAEASDGFIWRLKGDGGNATDIRAFDDERMIVNMSVWESPEKLLAFVRGAGAISQYAHRRAARPPEVVRETRRTGYSVVVDSGWLPPDAGRSKGEIGAVEPGWIGFGSVFDPGHSADAAYGRLFKTANHHY